MGPEGCSDHPGLDSPSPQAGVPGFWMKLPFHGPCRILRPPRGLDSPSPPGRCARFLDNAASPWARKDTPTTPWAGLPVPPRAGCPVLGHSCLPMGPGGYSAHTLGWTPCPPRPVCPVFGRSCLPMGPKGYSDHPLGWILRPPRAGVPGS